jgi:NAD(P) transhydrogenase subunit alpha
MLAAFLGFQLIKRVSPLLHSPLMSLTNAIAAVVVVGAITITGEADATPLAKVLGFIAVAAATINAVSGLLITDRMLDLARRSGSELAEAAEQYIGERAVHCLARRSACLRLPRPRRRSRCSRNRKKFTLTGRLLNFSLTGQGSGLRAAFSRAR